MKKIVLGCLAMTAVAACEQTVDGVITRAPNAAEQACLMGVTRETNNPDVVLMASDFSQAGTLVRIGVGPSRAPWQCVAYGDGTVGEIASLTDEGAL